MDLLEDEVYQKQPSGSSNKKKKVLVLLILSIVLLILALGVNMILPKPKPSLSIEINGQIIDNSKAFLFYNDEQKNYISLKQLASLIDYKYFKGGYQEYTEDENKCYLEFDNLIIGFELSSNEIYKTIENSNIEYQIFKLKNNIIQANNELYISLEDIAEACNVVYTFDEINNKIVIQNAQYFIDEKSKQFTEASEYKGFEDSLGNKRAIAYGIAVITDKSERIGVLNIDTNAIDVKNTKIGFKYTTMEFDEYTQNFIVSTNGKYGVISKEGKLVLELKYEDLSIINYNPLMYSVKVNNKYGVINSKGQLIVPVEYDGLGCFSNKSANTNSTLIIKNLKNDEDGIVVKKENSYGIVNLSTGKLLGEACELKAIYSKVDEEGYFIEVLDSNKVFKLQDYLDIRNTEDVSING